MNCIHKLHTKEELAGGSVNTGKKTRVTSNNYIEELIVSQEIIRYYQVFCIPIIPILKANKILLIKSPPDREPPPII